MESPLRNLLLLCSLNSLESVHPTLSSPSYPSLQPSEKTNSMVCLANSTDSSSRSTPLSRKTDLLKARLSPITMLSPGNSPQRRAVLPPSAATSRVNSSKREPATPSTPGDSPRPTRHLQSTQILNSRSKDSARTGKISSSAKPLPGIHARTHLR